MAINQNLLTDVMTPTEHAQQQARERLAREAADRERRAAAQKADRDRQLAASRSSVGALLAKQAAQREERAAARLALQERQRQDRERQAAALAADQAARAADSRAYVQREREKVGAMLQSQSERNERQRQEREAAAAATRDRLARMQSQIQADQAARVADSANRRIQDQARSALTRLGIGTKGLPEGMTPKQALQAILEQQYGGASFEDAMDLHQRRYEAGLKKDDTLAALRLLGASGAGVDRLAEQVAQRDKERARYQVQQQGAATPAPTSVPTPTPAPTPVPTPTVQGDITSMGVISGAYDEADPFAMSQYAYGAPGNYEGFGTAAGGYSAPELTQAASQPTYSAQDIMQANVVGTDTGNVLADLLAQQQAGGETQQLIQQLPESRRAYYQQLLDSGAVTEDALRLMIQQELRG